jgi:AcrR family transcriptional regulator
VLAPLLPKQRYRPVCSTLRKGLYSVKHVGTSTSQGSATHPASDEATVRERVLETASVLFYNRGVRAVGVDLIVEEAGVAKTSLYRHFRTKDDLVASFLEREDADFWDTWDRVAERHKDNAAAELNAHLDWIAERLNRPNYRGCPQLNVAAEFPDSDHPARSVAAEHKRELRLRLQKIAERLRVKRPDELAGQLSLLINGAFVSSQVLASDEANPLLRATAHALITAARRHPNQTRSPTRATRARG